MLTLFHFKSWCIYFLTIILSVETKLFGIYRYFPAIFVSPSWGDCFGPKCLQAHPKSPRNSCIQVNFHLLITICLSFLFFTIRGNLAWDLVREASLQTLVEQGGQGLMGESTEWNMSFKILPFTNRAITDQHHPKHETNHDNTNSQVQFYSPPLKCPLLK